MVPSVRQMQQGQVNKNWVLSQHRPISWWRHQMETFLPYWPFMRWIHRSPVNSPQKGQWRGTLMFSLICVWINGWVNNRAAGDLRRHCSHYDVTVMIAWYQIKHSNDECGEYIELKTREWATFCSLSVSLKKIFALLRKRDWAQEKLPSHVCILTF